MLITLFVRPGFRCQKLPLDIFGGNNQVAFSGNRYAIGHPAGFSTHCFDDEPGACSPRIRPHVENFFRHEIHCGEEPEGEIDTLVVVVDRLGQVHDTNSPHVLRHPSLKFIK